MSSNLERSATLVIDSCSSCDEHLSPPRSPEMPSGQEHLLDDFNPPSPIKMPLSPLPPSISPVVVDKKNKAKRTPPKKPSKKNKVLPRTKASKEPYETSQSNCQGCTAKQFLIDGLIANKSHSDSREFKALKETIDWKTNTIIQLEEIIKLERSRIAHLECNITQQKKTIEKKKKKISKLRFEYKATCQCCLLEMEEHEDLRMTMCGHLFHQECIKNIIIAHTEQQQRVNIRFIGLVPNDGLDDPRNYEVSSVNQFNPFNCYKCPVCRAESTHFIKTKLDYFINKS